MSSTPAIFLFTNHSSKIKATPIERAPIMIAIGSDHGGVDSRTAWSASFLLEASR
jgi:hypothetical protein